MELRFDEDALRAIAEAAIERKTGARGLRSICERVLQQVMFDLPSMTGISGVVVHRECVTEGAAPEYVHAGQDDADPTTPDVTEAGAA